MKRVVTSALVVAACSLAVPHLAAGQSATSSPPAASAPASAPASSAGAARPVTKEGADPASAARDPKTPLTREEKNCASAERKLEKEQQYLKGIQENIASRERALKACGTKSLCAKLEADRKAMERLKERHEKRIVRFTNNRNVDCLNVKKG